MSITIDRLTKSFGGLEVVNDLSLEINDGEFVVLLGPSGCGKTTTLRIVAGLESASAGDVLIDAQRVNDLPPQRRDVAMVFQSYALYPHMSVAENIAYPLRVRKIEAARIQTQVSQTAALLKIESLLARKPRELSGGERQRVALARAIVRHPRAFLMDEPLSNLDAKLRLQMRAELKHLQRELGTTTLYVTHDQAEAMTLGHRVAVLDKGRLQQFDSPLNIYNRPANRFVAEFVGSPGMNFLNGEIDQDSFRVGQTSLQLPASRTGLPRGPVTLGVRPEHVRISITPGDGWQTATVYVTELMGNESFVFVQFGDERIVARAPGDFRAEAESTVWLDFDMEHAHFFDRNYGFLIETSTD
jgi:multiple sugar transport system ATP-binding protein